MSVLRTGSLSSEVRRALIRTAGLPIFIRSRLLRRPKFPRRPLLWLGLPSIMLVAIGTMVAFLMLYQTSPTISASLSDGATDLPLDRTFRVVPFGWGARLESARLWEVATLGGTSSEVEVPLRVQVVRQGLQPGETEVALGPAAGSLRPDRTYRLALESTALAAALPVPVASVEREIQFTTLASPRPLPAPATAPRWGEPLAIRWSQPIEDFRYEVSPPTSTRAWVDQTDRRTAYVALEDPREATTYQVTVTDARGVNGVRLQDQATYQVATPARPRLLAGNEPLPVEVGQPVTLSWNVPVERADYTLEPPLESTLERDPGNPALMRLSLKGLAQDTEYRLTITAAAAQSGAPMAESRTLVLVTPPPLEVESIESGESGQWITTSARPTVTFREPVRDRAAAEAAIAIEPPVPGSFEWIDDRQVTFVPDDGLPYETEVTVRVQPGPDAARSAAGGYLDEGAELSFTTVPNKTIDVDLSRQIMTLYEGDQPVRTLVVSTGVRGADTPTGEFRVQYRMASARFRGVNTASGTSYDLANVKWVLAFLGDYTIHGAYWRQAFGRPASNGCVSLTDADAKIVYDWAPDGTLIRIHY